MIAYHLRMVTLTCGFCLTFFTTAPSQEHVDTYFASARDLTAETGIFAFRNTYGWLTFQRGDEQTALLHPQGAAVVLPAFGV